MAEGNKKRRFKRKCISLEDKIRILNRLKDGERVSSVAKSLILNEATVRAIKKREDKIRKSVIKGRLIDMKRVARVRDIDMIRMENALMVWLDDCTDKKIPLSGNVIRRKALKIYNYLKQIGHSSGEQQTQSFVASKGWFEKMKKRLSLHNIKLQEEQTSVNAKVIRKFTEELHEIVDKEKDQISSGDETALHCKKLPSRTYIRKNERHTEELSVKQLVELIHQPTSNTSIDNNLESANDDLSPYLSSDDIQRAIDLCKQAELHIVKKDPSVVRSEQFKKELQRCLLPYQKLLTELQSDNTSISATNLIRLNNKDIASDEDFQLKRVRKN